ncbi:hypothetical protein AAH979_02555 [Plantactinospora sp. ZYX-F-223]|uniref:hypothetical protein n=1 Tax=Plantactinospora sp. ZYX-F-223 TaxID=3144103 RepID=UPI0031FBC212
MPPPAAPPPYPDLPEPDGGVRAVSSSYRTCVSVVVATALALAAAVLTGGEFGDEEIRMLRPVPPPVGSAPGR